MNDPAAFALLADYNAWMNAKLYEAAGRLSAQELAADRGGYFGSLLGTLNHLVVADTLWLKRFAAHPAQAALLDPVRTLPKPATLDETVFADLPNLHQRRQLLDAVIKAWVPALTAADLAYVLAYTNTRGDQSFKRRLASLLLHFFNHQTHHRGQATTLLTQAGQDVGVTDLLVLMPADDGLAS